MFLNQCDTKKRCFPSIDEVKEALIYQRALLPESAGYGPCNYYFCELCGNYHMTSKGGMANFLLQPEIVLQINRERQKIQWEQRIR